MLFAHQDGRESCVADGQTMMIGLALAERT
jgi:hypothetical protein